MSSRGSFISPAQPKPSSQSLVPSQSRSHDTCCSSPFFFVPKGRQLPRLSFSPLHFSGRCGRCYRPGVCFCCSFLTRSPSSRGDPPRRARGEPPSWHIGSITNRSSVKVNTRDINQYRPGGAWRGSGCARCH